MTDDSKAIYPAYSLGLPPHTWEDRLADSIAKGWHESVLRYWAMAQTLTKGKDRYELFKMEYNARI